MITIKINGLEFLSKPSISILEACKNVGITIPRFCYHELLSVSGNCRMCLVEIEGMEKPVASCVTEITESMSIFVDSPFVKKAREGVLEALLLHHPLDCPICDQAGECDLQDQSKTFGNSSSRYFFNKKGTEDKYCGPLIKTIMTRCIKCTRCVRFAEEISGNSYFGTLNRGVETEISSYLASNYNSEISGNVIDLCPVGALTSKQYAFKARPWELRLVETCDISDSLGSNIYVNYSNSNILRVLPKNTLLINENFITDKARFNFDANNVGRIKNPEIGNVGKFEAQSWKNIFNQFDTYYLNKNLNFYVNQEIDLMTLVTLKKLENCSNTKSMIIDLDAICNKDNLFLANSIAIKDYKLNKKNFIVLIGTNLRFENALINSRIRRKYKEQFCHIFGNGNFFQNSYMTQFVNINIANIFKAFEGKCKILSKFFLFPSRGLIFVGQSFMNRISYNDQILSYFKFLFKSIQTIYIPNLSNTQGLQMLNISKKNKSVCSQSVQICPKENFINYKIKNSIENKLLFVGTHLSSLKTNFKFVLPALTPFEHAYSFINLEFRARRTQPSLPKYAFSEAPSKILNALCLNKNALAPNWFKYIEESLDFPSKFTSLNKKRFLEKANFLKNFNLTNFKVNKYPLKLVIKDFHMSSKISFHSPTMKECSKQTLKDFTNFSF